MVLIVVYKVVVTESGKEIDCGVALTGGDPLVRVMHPIYWGAYVNIIEKDDLTIYRYKKTKLDQLYELKERFEAGEWDKYRSPGSRYASQLPGCGFPHQYLDYYSEVKRVDVGHFKALYHEKMLACKKQVIPILNKYSAHSYPGRRPNPEESMNIFWESNAWRKY
ncbi:MAG: hypothetical protein QM500_19755 [Methylococcales bacterium]